MVGINTNINSLNAASTLNSNSVAQSSAMQQLSTGLRINSSKDDAAGLAIVTGMNSNIRGVIMAVRNISDGISLSQTADSALSSVTNMLQRMRELAVQSSNGTLTSSNRASMQLEVTQLVSEINNIGNTSNFNGIKLFDGSASNLSLQTNAYAGNTVNLGVSAMNSNLLGLGSRSGLTATGFDYAGTSYGISAAVSPSMPVKSLSSGDLILNGVTVGSSTAESDTLSSSFNSASAIAKVAAINAVSAQTGVTATALSTDATGIAMTAFVPTAGTATLSASLNINGVTISGINLVGNTATDRTTTVAAINSYSAQTGVVATDTGSDYTGVSLSAADGRNITAQVYNTTAAGTANTVTAAMMGVNANAVAATATNPAANLFTGSFVLASTTNSPITIATTVTGNISNSGLSVGTYNANTTYMSSLQRGTVNGAAAGTAATIASATAMSLQSGDLVINGVAIGAALSSYDKASDTTATGSLKSASAIAMAAAINAQSSATGVTATANANTFVGTNFTAFTAAQKANLYINGVQIAISTTSTTGAKAADVVNAINAYAGSTGVVASDNGQGLTLTAQDGRNLELGIGTAGGVTLTAANLGLSPSVATIGNSGTSGYTAIATGVDSLASASYASTYYAGVTLSSQTNFTITAGSKGSSATNNALVDLNSLGFQAGTYGGSNNGTSISQINIGTVAGSQTAMTAIDAALSTISNQRSNLGAVQNRLQSAVDNLTTSTTNLQTAQGRIQDTDYSATTTALSKAQIISQAATAMLAQANQQPQLVLSLLK